MTHDEINALSGRELDALVAEKVMGMMTRLSEGGEYIGRFDISEPGDLVYDIPDDPYGVRYVPHYSTDIAAAWLAVEKLEQDQREILFKITRLGSSMKTLIFQAEFRECRGSFKHYWSDTATAPLAICRAALMAVQK